MRSITINGLPIAVSVVRSIRKTIQLKIVSPTQVEVRIPSVMTDKEVQKLLSSKRGWLETHLLQAVVPPSSVLPNTLLFFGREVPLRLCTDSSSGSFSVNYTDTDFTLLYPPATSDEDIRDAIISYYRMMAGTVLEEKSSLWAKRIGVTYNRITIKGQKTRWGSCSAKQNLNYNWRIIQAPEELIDYIVIHELCHLRHLNHSKAFWQMVSKFDPNYTEHRRRLQQMGFRLMTSLQ